jgi:sec-independent protein translocase protein TatC
LVIGFFIGAVLGRLVAFELLREFVTFMGIYDVARTMASDDAADFATGVGNAVGFVVEIPLLVYFLSRRRAGRAGASPPSRRSAIIVFTVAAIAFFAEALLGWAVVFNINFGFSGEFNPTEMSRLTTSAYGFAATRISFAVGLVVETPVVVVFLLARLRIVRSTTFQRLRAPAAIAIFFLTLVFVPYRNLLTIALPTVVWYLLYELGILLARIAAPETDEFAPPSSASTP